MTLDFHMRVHYFAKFEKKGALLPRWSTLNGAEIVAVEANSLFVCLTPNEDSEYSYQWRRDAVLTDCESA